MMQGKWFPFKDNPGAGCAYKIGRIKVGFVSYSAFASKGDPKAWSANILLPSIKIKEDRFENIEDAKSLIERAVGTWFSSLEDKP